MEHVRVAYNSISYYTLRSDCKGSFELWRNTRRYPWKDNGV